MSSDLKALLLLISGSLGCYTGVETAPVVHASFELPEGWAIIYDEPGYVSIGNGIPSKDEVVPQVKLEIIPSHIIVGDEAFAKSYVEELYDRHEYDDLSPPAMETLALPSGKVVYVYLSQETYWGSPTWTSVFSYHADGHVIVMYLTDRADLYMDELDLITKTTTVEMR